MIDPEKMSRKDIAELLCVDPVAITHWSNRHSCPRNDDGSYPLKQFLKWREEWMIKRTESRLRNELTKEIRLEYVRREKSLRDKFVTSNRSCINCGEQISFKYVYSAKFCNKKCSDDYKHKISWDGIKKDKVCLYCKKPISTDFGAVWYKKRQYCNNKCTALQGREKSRDAVQLKPCAYCKKIMPLRIDDIAANYRLRAYCSRDCIRAANPKKEKTRTSLREYRKQKCENCGMLAKELPKGYTLHVHHKDSDFNNNNLDNLITLCKPCHDTAHSEIFRIRRETLGLPDKAMNCSCCGKHRSDVQHQTLYRADLNDDGNDRFLCLDCRKKEREESSCADHPELSTGKTCKGCGGLFMRKEKEVIKDFLLHQYCGLSCVALYKKNHPEEFGLAVQKGMEKANAEKKKDAQVIDEHWKVYRMPSSRVVQFDFVGDIGGS